MRHKKQFRLKKYSVTSLHEHKRELVVCRVAAAHLRVGGAACLVRVRA